LTFLLLLLMSVGVPIKLMHECEGHVVTLELKSGEMYRGTLVEAEDNMNCELVNVSFTVRQRERESEERQSDRGRGSMREFSSLFRLLQGKDGQKSPMERVFIRGSNVRFVIMPDMLANAPMFKKFGQKAAALPGSAAAAGARGAGVKRKQ